MRRSEPVRVEVEAREPFLVLEVNSETRTDSEMRTVATGLASVLAF